MNVTGAASVMSEALKDTFGAQLITKTLDKLNTNPTNAGQVNADYQFQKDVLSAAGIGNNLDIKV